MKSLVFEFPFLPPSLNAMLGKNRWALRNEKDKFTHQAISLILNQSHETIKGQVRILVDLCFVKKRNRDLDNYTGGLKWLLDTFRGLGVIEEDNSNIVRELNVQIYDGERKNCMIVKIEQIKDETRRIADKEGK